MSWDGWITSLLGYGIDAKGTSNVTSAGIFSHEGAICATTPGFKVDAAQLKLALKLMRDPSQVGSSPVININGIGFRVLRATDDFIMLKLKEHGSAYIEKSKTLLVVGVCAEDCSVGTLNNAVAKICTALGNSNL